MDVGPLFAAGRPLRPVNLSIDLPGNEEQRRFLSTWK